MSRRYMLPPSSGLSLAISLVTGASYDEDGRGTQGKGQGKELGSSQWENSAAR
jgi:hypothetical protein